MIRQIGNATLYRGLCLEFLRDLAEASVDAIVCDPPYGLSFMGKRWDYDVPSVEVWAECLRVLKPGGHLLAFAGTRTQHRMAVRIEDAGFEIRDMIAWVYSSGFPKSLDVSKAIDRAAGVEREVTGQMGKCGMATAAENYEGNEKWSGLLRDNPATPEAQQWVGWGTALKPALEPITVARKPLSGTVAQNVLAHGTGGLNIDGCRVGDMVETWPKSRSYAPGQFQPGHSGDTQSAGEAPAGRWPANLIHNGSEEVLAAFPQAPGQSGAVTGREPSSKTRNTFGLYNERPEGKPRGDTGSAARFFYCAKASGKDRDEGVAGVAGGMSGRRDGSMGSVTMRKNTHPTVKPTDLMRYLCRLVTPPGGVVLDPFTGSGSTGKAAILEGFRFIGIEREAEYVEIARARIAAAQAEEEGESDPQMGLPMAAHS